MKKFNIQIKTVRSKEDGEIYIELKDLINVLKLLKSPQAKDLEDYLVKLSGIGVS